MAKINPSTFRHYVTLEQRARTADGLGGATVAWTTHAKMWAEIKPLSANQRLFANRLQHNVTHTITTRYRGDITASIEKRFVWEGRYFQIHGVVNVDEKKCFLQISVIEGEAS